METVYNKLVRDNIPDIIEKNKETAVFRILSDDEYREALYSKLSEECNEVITAEAGGEILEEAADVFEVLRAIAELEGKSIDDVISLANIKKEKRGGFSKRVFLEKTIV